MAQHMTAAATEPCAEGVERLLEDLRRRCGLKRDELLARKVVGVLRQHAAAERKAWVEDLLGRPAHDPRWLAFVETVTVHETYFFRDPDQLEVLRRAILPALLAERARRGRRRLDIWSAGCASGEEAYTVAILVLDALAEAGEDPDLWSLHVLGTDISRTVIARAEDGVYGGPGLDAFRRLPDRYAAWFVAAPEAGGQCRRVCPEVMRRVSFRQHNLMDRDPPEAGFDLALCRNVFIYFDEDGQERAIAMLRRGLAEPGYLLLGVTDRLASDSGFVRAATGTAVIYEKRESAP